MILKHNPQLSRYEKAILKIKGTSPALKSLWSGCSRAARLSQAFDDSHRQTIWETGTNVIGPLFFAYIFWVLNQAKAMGLKRLYFIARDGQIFLEIADIIKQNWGCDIECRYLYGSRKSLFLPALHRVTPYHLSWILGPVFSFCSVQTSCEHVNLDPCSIKKSLQEEGFPKETWDKGLSLTGRKRLKKCLMREDVQSIVRKKSDEKFATTLGYLQQEELTDHSTPWALVDIGWRGRSLVSISQILDKAKLRPPQGLKGFFFGISQSKSFYKNDQMYGFLFDLSKRFHNVSLHNGYLLESLASATHGRTVGYQKKDNRFEPILEDPQSANWGIALQHEAASAFAKKITEKIKEPSFFIQFPWEKIAAKTLEIFLHYPTHLEAETYGTFSMGAVLTEKDFIEIGPKIDYQTFWRSFILDQRSSGWPMGSFVRSRLPYRNLMNRLYRILYFAKAVVIFFRDKNKITR